MISSIMFVESMSGKELNNAYNLDLPELQKLTLQFSESSYVCSLFNKKRKDHSVILSKVFVTKRNNRYIGILVYINTGSKKKNNWEWTSHHIGMMNTENGECAIAFFQKSNQTIKFTSHFFKRYKERFCRTCDWKVKNEIMRAKTITDIVTIYMKRNPDMVWMETESVFYNKVHIFSPLNDGVALLQWDKDRKLLQANTFITIDMLNEKQIKMVEYAMEYLLLPNSQKEKINHPDFVFER